MAVGERFIYNLGIVDPIYNAKAYASNWVDLTGTGADVDLPIIHELGSEEIKEEEQVVASSGTTITIIDATTYDLEISSSLTNFRFDLSTVNASEYRVKISFNAAYTSGTMIIEGYYSDAKWNSLNYTIVEGYNEFEVNRRDTNVVRLGNGPIGTALLRMSEISVKEITIPDASYLTYLDYASLSHKTIQGNTLPISTVHNLTDTFQSYFTTDVPVTDADRAILDADPEAIYRLWFGDTGTGLSFAKSNVKNFIPGNEGLR